MQYITAVLLHYWIPVWMSSELHLVYFTLSQYLAVIFSFEMPWFILHELQILYDLFFSFVTFLLRFVTVVLLSVIYVIVLYSQYLPRVWFSSSLLLVRYLFCDCYVFRIQQLLWFLVFRLGQWRWQSSHADVSSFFAVTNADRAEYSAPKTIQ